MLRIAFAFAFVCLAGVCDAKPAAPAAQQAKCLGYTAAILSKIRDMIEADASYEIHEYSAERAAKVLAAFNAVEPKTDYKADRIMVLSNSEHGEGVMVLLFLKGCLVQAGRTPAKQWHEIIESAIGDES